MNKVTPINKTIELNSAFQLLPQLPAQWRKTTQELAPAEVCPLPPGDYNIFGSFPLGPGQISVGFTALAQILSVRGQVVIDGYGGVFWSNFRAQLEIALNRIGVRASFVEVNHRFKSESQINELIAPFIGGDDPLFGKRFDGNLEDFFAIEKLQHDPQAELSIIYGTGAALFADQGYLVYVDVPKNEIQFRSRAGSICNLGQRKSADPKAMYKQFYFVDWIALNQHKANLLPRIDLVIDEQRPQEPMMMAGKKLRSALETMSQNYFRVRPWFEPGPWGGQWIKQRIPKLSKTSPNYAWSFELIFPENGVLLESDGRLLEISSDFLLYHNNEAVLGNAAERFGHEFPIRFDFLDTFGGGNLSVQCHPRPEYIKEQFGETFTQDESYYILDCEQDSRVYLGFRQDADLDLFRAELEKSVEDGTPVEIENFVNVEPAKKHDLFLIPNGTIHCSGQNNLVLEISSTPYIFTFKMYDWMRLDLDGKPRPLNIARAFDNLYFDRRGRRIKDEFISQPELIDAGRDWQLFHLPTHEEQFYDVHRFEFQTVVSSITDGSCHVLSLVEGAEIELQTSGGLTQRFNYAETFVIPAAAGSYRLINRSDKPVKVIKAFIKKTHEHAAGGTK
ncbi:MAG: class I mannose-6-phosphate isomerase [Candidatus Obscuribacterales bacterium]|nr:class I mannose-6-phosphate isomerase [Candidatus Obscuribacterales bacterium]